VEENVFQHVQGGSASPEDDGSPNAEGANIKRTHANASKTTCSSMCKVDRLLLKTMAQPIAEGANIKRIHANASKTTRSSICKVDRLLLKTMAHPTPKAQEFTRTLAGPLVRLMS
jgi:hypothetical protein